jgi:hypothetical protein
MQTKQFLREKQQAAVLSISQRTLREWRAGKIVPYFKVGRVVFYDPERVAFLVPSLESLAVGTAGIGGRGFLSRITEGLVGLKNYH